MKKLLLLTALLLPMAAQAQIIGGRASVGVDYKIAKGLHITAEEEIRSADSFSSLGSLRTTLGLTYKPAKFLKVGVGYTLINPWKVDKELDDGTLYTGCTPDLDRRIQAHNAGRGAKYTRARLPVRLVYHETLPGRSAALRREAELKSFTRAEKLRIIQLDGR